MADVCDTHETAFKRIGSGNSFFGRYDGYHDSGSGSGNNSSGDGKDKAREGLREDAMLILRGALIALGIFIRFTTAIFVATLMMFESLRFLQTSKLMMEFLRRSSIVVVSFAVVASAIAKSDAKYYERKGEEFYFAPWHALAYNMKFAAEHHGKHFRFTHLLFNGFIMFGPAYALCLWREVMKGKRVPEKKYRREWFGDG